MKTHPTSNDGDESAKCEASLAGPRQHQTARKEEALPNKPNRQQEFHDDMIRARFDGIDVLRSGTSQAAFASLSLGIEGLDALWNSTLDFTFTGRSTRLSPEQAVTDMLWSSSGREPPEMILDGTGPGADGRWSVRIEEARQKENGDVQLLQRRKTTAELQPLPSSVTFDGGTPLVPTSELRRRIWGPDSGPAHLIESSESTTEEDDSSADDKQIVNFAARCSVPIDIDDDSFMICKTEHIQSIYDLSGRLLAKGNFRTTSRLFDMMLHGLDGAACIPELVFAKGAVLHNMGVIKMWMLRRR